MADIFTDGYCFLLMVTVFIGDYFFMNKLYVYGFYGFF